MSKVKLLALWLHSLLLDACASYQLFATDNLIGSTIARDDQGLPCCHYYRQMIHTIPNPVKLFLKTIDNNVLKLQTHGIPIPHSGRLLIDPLGAHREVFPLNWSGERIYATPKPDRARTWGISKIIRQDAEMPSYKPNKNQKDCLAAGFHGKMHEFTE